MRAGAATRTTRGRCWKLLIGYDIVGLAESADAGERPKRRMDMPRECAARNGWRASKAKAQIEAAAAQDFTGAAQFSKAAEREAAPERRRRPGPAPAAPSRGDPKAQVNLTDADSRIMKVKGLLRAVLQRAAADMESRLIVAPAHQAVNDKQQLIRR
jgi:hypothetical protein